MTEGGTDLIQAVEHGEVFTRRWIVDLILDLSGYRPDEDLAALRAVEPACGSGAFLGPMVERLSASIHRCGKTLADASDAIRAFDLVPEHVETSRRLVAEVLAKDGWDKAEAGAIAEKWISEGDYLLRDPEAAATDIVVGNPPYIRMEEVPAARSAAYRRACPTMTGRADIYVGFMEVALRSLKPGGVLGFIVADRWMRNQYGRGLRQMISRDFSVEATIQMHDVDAFEEQVSAYPAITIIRRTEQGPAVVADTTRQFGPSDAASLVEWTANPQAEPLNRDRFQVARLPHWFPGTDLWPTGGPVALAMVEELNDRFGPIEDKATGTRIGIGVATGADKVFVTKDPDAVEPERLLPLSMGRDTNSGTLTWSGHYLVNPWDQQGNLVALQDWPRFARYLDQNAEALRKRNIANRQPERWYRTIDKVTASLTDRPKLLFPDMRMTSRPVYDPGGLYPHHNVYFVISDAWDLRVLGGLLFSRVAEATVGAYCVKMRGGTLRFQAQYLRRVRVPLPSAITDEDASALADAFQARDARAATEAALSVYGLSGPIADWLIATSETPA